MSYQATTWAIKQRAVASPTSRHVLLVMANYAQPNGQDAYPSVNTLAEETGLSERSVRRAIAELKEAGVIKHGNQRIVEAKDYPINKRPVVYDMDFSVVDAPNLGCHSVIPNDEGVPHSPVWGATQSSLGCHSGTQIVKPNSKEKSHTTPLPPKPPKPKIPDWIPVEAWNGFLEMRASIKKPLKTDRAVTLIVNKLDQLRQQGQDPGDVLDQSTSNGWQGVFAVKEDAGSKPQRRLSLHDQLERNIPSVTDPRFDHI